MSVQSGRPNQPNSPITSALKAAGLPSSVQIADVTVRAALTEGRWDLRVQEASHGRYELAVVPANTPATVGERPDAVRYGPDLIDYSIAEISEGPVGPRPALRPGSGATADLPWQAEDGFLYRGVSWEEWHAFLASGIIQSDGSYNLGGAQEGLTYFTPDPQMAAAYASSYQPWHRVPTFERPGYVIKIRRPADDRLDLKSAPDPEVGVKGPISAEEVVGSIEVRPYAISTGRHVITEGHAGYEAASRTSPRGYYGYVPVPELELAQVKNGKRNSLGERSVKHILETEPSSREHVISEPFTYFQQCDLFRSRFQGGEDAWQQMMAEREEISVETFLSEADVTGLLDEEESFDQFLESHPDLRAYRSVMRGIPCLFLETAGFEFIHLRPRDHEQFQRTKIIQRSP